MSAWTILFYTFGFGFIIIFLIIPLIAPWKGEKKYLFTLLAVYISLGIVFFDFFSIFGISYTKEDDHFVLENNESFVAAVIVNEEEEEVEIKEMADGFLLGVVFCGLGTGLVCVHGSSQMTVKYRISEKISYRIRIKMVDKRKFLESLLFSHRRISSNFKENFRFMGNFILSELFILHRDNDEIRELFDNCNPYDRNDDYEVGKKLEELLNPRLEQYGLEVYLFLSISISS
jgi:hypothetical protein